MTTFWDASDKIPVRQTKVAIQAEHGLDYSAGQKITIVVPPTVQYFQPKESYLSFQVKLNQGGAQYPCRIQLDAEAGAQVLVKDLRILSGGSGAQLLEEYQDYNVLAALRYDYETDETLRNKRALTEGCTAWDQTTRGTRGTTKSDCAGLAHNPYFKAYDNGTAPTSTSALGLITAGEVWGDADTLPVGAPQGGDAAAMADNGGNKSVEVKLPLHTGIFQNSKVFPTLLTEGLRIEILLESAPRVMRMLESTQQLQKRWLAPMFHSAGTHGGLGGDEANAAGTGRWSSANNGGVIDRMYFRRDNNQIGIDNFPFVVGQQVTVMNTAQDRVNNDAVAGQFPHFTTVNNGHRAIIQSITHMAGTGAAVGIGGWWGLTRIIFSEALTLTAAHSDGSGQNAIDGSAGRWVLVDAGVQQDTAMAPSYTISNTELILQQLEMPAGYTRKMMSMMKQGGTLNYDFLSSTNYKYSQLAGDIVANIRLPLNQSRARAILSVPTDASVYSAQKAITGTSQVVGTTGAIDIPPVWDTDAFTYVEEWPIVTAGSQFTDVNNAQGAAGSIYGKLCQPNGLCCSMRSGLVGISDYISSYQWFYNGQLNPNRKVDVSKISSKESISQQGLIELEKALAMSGIRPLSFRKYDKNFCIGRALSLQDGVYDTRGRDFNLQLEYSGTAPSKNKLWCSFVHHIRRIQFRGDAISLQI